MEGRIANNSDDGLSGLLPFLIFILIGFFRFVLSKKREKKQASRPTSPAQQPVPIPKKPLQTISTPSPFENLIDKELAESSKKAFYSPSLSKLEGKRGDEHYSRREKKKNRIQNLVKSAGGKRKMILLTEILKKDHYPNF